MAKQHSKPQDVARHYESLRGGPDDTPEDKLKATAKYFGITVTSAKRQLRFWWSGPKYLREFPPGPKKTHKQKWDVSTKALPVALNKHGLLYRKAKVWKWPKGGLKVGWCKQQSLGLLSRASS